MGLSKMGWLLLPLIGACHRPSTDFENICLAEERSGASRIADPAERAHHTALWIESNLHTAVARRWFSSVPTVPCEAIGGILLSAARENGYSGACPTAEGSDPWCAARRASPLVLASPANGSPGDPASTLFAEGEDAVAQRISTSSRPLRPVAELLTTRGTALYGRALPVYALYGGDRARFADDVTAAGCPAAMASQLDPLDRHAREFLLGCGPAGAALLARRTPDVETTVGRAAMALLLESLATEAQRRGSLHRALMTALLGPERSR